MGSSRVNPHSPETWRGVHVRLVEEPTLVQDHVGGALAVSSTRRPGRGSASLVCWYGGFVPQSTWWLISGDR
ncbi:unnamed protein product [Ectocarpus sp. 8 AP-2014]